MNVDTLAEKNLRSPCHRDVIQQCFEFSNFCYVSILPKILKLSRWEKDQKTRCSLSPSVHGCPVAEEHASLWHLILGQADDSFFPLISQ